MTKLKSALIHGDTMRKTHMVHIIFFNQFCFLMSIKNKILMPKFWNDLREIKKKGGIRVEFAQQIDTLGNLCHAELGET